MSEYIDEIIDEINDYVNRSKSESLCDDVSFVLTKKNADELYTRLREVHCKFAQSYFYFGEDLSVVTISFLQKDTIFIEEPLHERDGKCKNHECDVLYLSTALPKEVIDFFENENECEIEEMYYLDVE